MREAGITVESGGVWRNPLCRAVTPRRFVLLYEIEYQKRTCGETVINGTAYPVAADTLIFARPGDVRCSRFADPAGVETLFFRFSATGAFAALLDSVPHAAPADATAAALWQAASEGFEARAGAAGETALHAALVALLARLAQKGGAARAAPPSPAQRALFAAIRYMEAHVGEAVTVAELAAEAGYSRTQFSYLFRTYTGHTPHAYFRSLKIAAARRMLLQTDKSLAAIAAALGFSNAGKFGGAFRAECGVSPGKFRRQGEIAVYEE